MLGKRRARWTVVGLVAAAAAGVLLASSVTASARDGHGQDGRDEGGTTTAVTTHEQGGEHEGRALLRLTLAPSVPTDPAIHGVAAGGLPWVLDRGTVRLATDGRLRVRVEGLVIPVAHGTFPAGTAAPVTSVSASLYCAPDSSAAAATTAAVPLSADGNASIDETIAVPATCLAPTVLVHPNGSAAAYIAAPGWRG